MKRYLIISLFALAACNNNTPAAKDDKSKVPVSLVNNPQTADGMDTVAAARKPIMYFADSVHEFGTIHQNEVVSHEFAFSNTGKTDLIITSATGSCGCTVADYPREPIAPGKGGVMKVTFNSAGKTGHQVKTVTIRTNALPNVHLLAIKADIAMDTNK